MFWILKTSSKVFKVDLTTLKKSHGTSDLREILLLTITSLVTTSWQIITTLLQKSVLNAKNSKWKWIQIWTRISKTTILCLTNTLSIMIKKCQQMNRFWELRLLKDSGKLMNSILSMESFMKIIRKPNLPRIEMKKPKSMAMIKLKNCHWLFKMKVSCTIPLIWKLRTKGDCMRKT